MASLDVRHQSRRTNHNIFRFLPGIFKKVVFKTFIYSSFLEISKKASGADLLFKQKQKWCFRLVPCKTDEQVPVFQWELLRLEGSSFYWCAFKPTVTSEYEGKPLLTLHRSIWSILLAHQHGTANSPLFISILGQETLQISKVCDAFSVFSGVFSRRPWLNGVLACPSLSLLVSVHQSRCTLDVR